MARPSKSTAVLESENKSHRTKSELNARKEAEASLLTGIEMKEAAATRADPIAHKEFARVKKILKAVGKNDALFEAVVNEYCMLKSDIERYTTMRLDLEDRLEKAHGDTALELYKLIAQFDKQIQDFKKKRFDIEKENGMTIASQMRSIPKTQTKAKNPLLEILEDEDDE